jgi:hypothetical protein
LFYCFGGVSIDCHVIRDNFTNLQKEGGLSMSTTFVAGEKIEKGDLVYQSMDGKIYLAPGNTSNKKKETESFDIETVRRIARSEIKNYVERNLDGNIKEVRNIANEEIDKYAQQHIAISHKHKLPYMDRTAERAERSGESWSKFEHENVADALLALVHKKANQFGRGYLAIKWEIYNQLKRELVG